MRKFIITVLTIIVICFGLSFLILFDASIDKSLKWWSSFSHDRPYLPYSPYKIRRVDSAFLRTEEGNKVKFIDKHLFWKGSGAVALPELTVSGKLVNLIIQSNGIGYSDDVEAIVTGTMGSNFRLGDIIVEDGGIKGIKVLQSSKWHSSPKVFWGNEEIPFTGTAEKLFSNGQVMIQNQFLSGKLHGKCEEFMQNGLKVHSKDFKNGKKHGTHIFWHKEPQQPENYVYVDKNNNMYGSLWLEVNEIAKDKFGSKYGTPESNEYVMKLFRQKQGYQQVKLLEHWDQNRKHGLFEAFDRFGNKTFKDEFKYGLRVKHKTFDKTKTESFDRKKEG